jgi:hypothetical protein
MGYRLIRGPSFSDSLFLFLQHQNSNSAMVALVYNTQGNDKGDSNTSIPLQNPQCIRIVCISDTHGSTRFNVPDGDILGLHIF